MDKNQSTKQYVVVKLDKEQYGIDIQQVQTIIRMKSITRVPKAPYFIKGVINLRGDIIPVMSLRMKFNLEQDEYSNDTRIIIVKLEENSMGVIVDEVREVLQLSSESIESVQGFTSDADSNYIHGVGKIGENIITLLNLKNLIDINLEEKK